MSQQKLSISDRNSRYLLVFSFISVVLIALNKSVSMLEYQLNKIYVSQTNVPYLKMSQIIPAVAVTSCLFLIVVLIKYIYHEANTFSNQENATIQQIANKSYEHILHYLMLFFILFTTFFILSIISENFKYTKNDFILSYFIFLVISIVISIFSSRLYSKKYKRNLPHLSVDIGGSAIFMLFCIGILIPFLSQPTIANLEIKYDGPDIEVNLEGTSNFEELQIKVNDILIDDFVAQEENYFVSTYRNEEISTNTENQNQELDVFLEKNNGYLYFTKTVDINNYVIEGINSIQISLKIGDRSYEFINPLIITDSKYEYVKDSYQTEINSKS